jgi:predicted nucleic acid-binding protein
VIALDTSALLRYLTNDDPHLASQVAATIDGPDPAGISTLVLLEATFALRSARYGWDNPQLADTVIDLLAHEGVVLFDVPATLAIAAIAGVRHLSARHIADALISASARHAGASALVTNDRKFGSEIVDIRQLLKPGD